MSNERDLDRLTGPAHELVKLILAKPFPRRPEKQLFVLRKIEVEASRILPDLLGVTSLIGRPEPPQLARFSTGQQQRLYFLPDPQGHRARQRNSRIRCLDHLPSHPRAPIVPPPIRLDESAATDLASEASQAMPM